MKKTILAILFSVLFSGIAIAQRTTVPGDLQVKKVELGTEADSIGLLDSKGVLKYVPQTTLLDRAELQIQPKLNLKENLSNKATDFSIINHTKYPSVQAVQTELGNYINNSQKAIPNGVASLDISGKIPMAQIPDALVGSVSYQGNYDASTNTPVLASSPSTSTKGHYYVVTEPGTQFGETYSLGDWIISNGTEWQKVDNNNDVASVFGRKGAVVPLESDYENFYFKKTGGNITGNTVIDPLNSNTNIAGSNLTVKKQSTETVTNVSQFIDVDRQTSSTPANLETNTFGLVSRVVNNSTVEDSGVTGSNLVGRHASSSNFNFAYGTINTGEVIGSGNGNFVTGTVNKSKVTGSSTIDYLRGISSTTTIDNTGSTVNFMQGSHNSLVFTSGSVGDATVNYLDIDGGSTTITGDLAYIRAGNDVLPTVNGNSYFIKSESILTSEFAGSIKSDIGFIGDGSQLSNVDAISLDGESKDDFTKRIDLSDQIQLSNYRKSVIALCLIDNTDIGRNSFSSGNIVFHRPNGFPLAEIIRIDFSIEKRYNAPGANYSFEIKGNKSNTDKLRFVRFEYNGQMYAGIEFYFNSASHNKVYFNGETNFEIFGLDYYNTQTSTVLNSEVNNSIDELELYVQDGFLVNGNEVGLPVGFYEEGTFTPTLVDQGGGATYSFTVNKSEYIRTGNNIMINIYLTNINTSGTPSGSLYISNLPELADSGSGGAVTIGNFYGSNLSSSNLDRIKSFFVSNNRVYFGPVQSNSTFSSVTFTSGTIRITANYKTNVYTP